MREIIKEATQEATREITKEAAKEVTKETAEEITKETSRRMTDTAMKSYKITRKMQEEFEYHLISEEKSPATIKKYMYNLNRFLGGYFSETGGEAIYITKEMFIVRKTELSRELAAGTMNGIITALNNFLSFCGFYELKMKYLRRQRRAFAEKELCKDEYMKLIQAAEEEGRTRLSLVIQTICSTGIRVSELKYVTAKAAHSGKAEVWCKGKVRVIFLSKKLRERLAEYMKENRIGEGPVFVTKRGKPLDRSNIWRDMKRLCRKAGVPREKIFPHNLRHLFARSFYEMEKDIVKLADILGHSGIETTRIYTMDSENLYSEKIEKMDLLI